MKTIHFGHVSKPRRNLIQTLLLAGCLMALGVLIGAVMVGHQSNIEHPGGGVAAERVVRARRSAEEQVTTAAPQVELQNVMNKTPDPTGALYTRWGRSVCPPGASKVYKGIMAGGHSVHLGGGAEYLCMAEDPEWSNIVSGTNGYSYIYGVEFKGSDAMFSKENSPAFLNHDGNCVICRSTRSVQLMIPGRKTCMRGWTREYHGILMSSKHDEKAQRNYICVDSAPEADREGYRADGGATLWPVEAACGSLPCPQYINGNEVTCVVCSQ